MTLEPFSLRPSELRRSLWASPWSSASFVSSPSFSSSCAGKRNGKGQPCEANFEPSVLLMWLQNVIFRNKDQNLLGIHHISCKCKARLARPWDDIFKVLFWWWINICRVSSCLALKVCTKQFKRTNQTSLHQVPHHQKFCRSSQYWHSVYWDQC